MADLQQKFAKIETELKDTRAEMEAMKTQAPSFSSKVASVLIKSNNIPLVNRRTENEVETAEIVEDKNDDVKNKVVLDKARRTLGFGPISREDIDRQYKECRRFGLPQNEDDAKTMAIRELMLLDMKISKTEQEEIIIVRSFAPRREHASMLYCEFSDMSSVNKVYSPTRHMRRGTTISPYIPKEFYERYRALEEICYRWRKEESSRTKVRMGEKGLEVWRKKSGEEEYTKVPLESLGELPPVTVNRWVGKQVNRSLTSSPPPGCPGYTPPSVRRKKGKRSRSRSGTKSPGSKSPLSKKTDAGGVGAEEVGGMAAGAKGGEQVDIKEKVSEEPSLVGEATISPITNGLLKKPDLGMVTHLLERTPAKLIQIVASDRNSTSSPIFRKSSFSA